MLTLLLAAAEAGHDEGSKTAFYLLGGALACWAVIVGALGVARPAFAQGESTGRIVMVVSFLLAIGAMATAVITAS